MVNCVPLCGPRPAGKVLRSKRKAQEPSVTVPLAALPPESNVTGPTLVPPKLPNCKVNACPCGKPSTVARLGPAPLVNAKDRLLRSLPVAGAPDVLLLPHPRTMSVPMTTRAIHCAMRRGRAICETVRGRVISSSFVGCASWLSCSTLQSSGDDVKKGELYGQTLRRRGGHRDGTTQKA